MTCEASLAEAARGPGPDEGGGEVTDASLTLHAARCPLPRQSSDLQRVAQATTGVSGVAHSVQGFLGELRGAFHHTADFQRCHVGGHQEGSNTLEEDVDEQA